MGRPTILSNIVCYHCGSKETSKAGRTKNGKQRFYCRSCRKFSSQQRQLRQGKKPRLADPPSAQHLILELQSIAQRIGRTPTTTIITELSKAGEAFSLHSYYVVFGSFLTALKKATLKPRYMQEFDDADRERLLNELRRLRAKLGRPLYSDDIDRARKKDLVSSPYHFNLAFGSVPKAIEAAGAAPKRYTREDMLTILQELDNSLHRPALTNDIKRLFTAGKGPSLKAFYMEFGTLRNAREAAGVKTVCRRPNGSTVYWQKFTARELIDQLKQLENTLGHPPQYREINAASKTGQCASVDTFVTTFGSLSQAHEAAGLVIETNTET